jgi:tryptophanyl-tRNA synthetase
MTDKTKYLYGIQPTGRIHVGNYLGGLKLAIEKDAEIMIADWHALTTSNSHDIFNSLIDLGANSVVYQNKEALPLAWHIQCKTPMSDLERMTQFKSKGASNVGLFTYPCLMAADIILSKCDEVIVGEDQIQHMEFYRRTCKRMGVSKIAKTKLTETSRIMSLSNPEKKMSKSEPKGCLYMNDKDYKKKIMKAVTNNKGRKNLENICKGLGGEIKESNKELKEEIIRVFNGKRN